MAPCGFVSEERIVGAVVELTLILVLVGFNFGVVQTFDWLIETRTRGGGNRVFLVEIVKRQPLRGVAKVLLQLLLAHRCRCFGVGVIGDIAVCVVVSGDGEDDAVCLCAGVARRRRVYLTLDCHFDGVAAFAERLNGECVCGVA